MIIFKAYMITFKADVITFIGYVIIFNFQVHHHHDLPNTQSS